MTQARAHLTRLTGYSPGEDPTDTDLAAAVAANAENIVEGLVAEALVSDDVLSASDAQAFIDERLAEWAGLLSRSLRTSIATDAAALIKQRAPDA